MTPRSIARNFIVPESSPLNRRSRSNSHVIDDDSPTYVNDVAHHCFESFATKPVSPGSKFSGYAQKDTPKSDLNKLDGFRICMCLISAF